MLTKVRGRLSLGHCHLGLEGGGLISLLCSQSSLLSIE